MEWLRGARLGLLLAALVTGVGLAGAQSDAPAAGTFRLFLLGREVGRETTTRTIEQSGRRVESILRLDGGGELAATIEEAFDWSPSRVSVRGEPLLGEDRAIEVTVANGRAEIRDGSGTTARDLGEGLFFPAAGALPVALQEELIAYWRNHGRPAEIPAGPAGPIRIQSRAEQQMEVNGRVATLERLSIEGPVWGRQTAWAEHAGRLDALVTWVDGHALQAVRDGFEPRLDQFVSQAIHDRLDDLERLSADLLPEEPEGVALTGATVIVSGGKPPMSDATVVIRDGRIAAVGPSSKVKVPENIPVRDVSGMTIAPGLWDLDARMSQIEFAPLYLAGGITGIRQTSSDDDFVKAYRDVLARRGDRLISPRVVPAALLDGPAPGAIAPTKVSDLDEARQAVRRLRSDGARFLDIGAAVPPEIAKDLASDAKRLGYYVAIRFSAGLTPQQGGALATDLIEGLPPTVAGGWTASDFAAWAKAKTVYAPEGAGAELLRAPGGTPLDWWQPGPATLPASLGQMFARAARASGRPDALDVVAAMRAAREAGVPLAAATGPGVPIAGLYRELALFVASGMTPAQAIEAATSIPAGVMKAGDSGTVESGKRADLIVLAANPLDDIDNIRTVKWVVANGRLYNCAKLWQAAGFATR